MRVIVAGSRCLISPRTTFEAIEEAQAAGWEIGEIVSGGAPGPDQHGARWGAEHDVPVHVMPANWRMGNGAGMSRNVDMAVYAATGPKPGGCILVWDGVSKGTKAMEKIAKKFGLLVYVKCVGRAA
jgi:hypothetical protein